MPIQWFPGHMHKARLEMQTTLPKVDVVIEVLDARIPYSSENPMLAELRGTKPCLKVLAKSDLADESATSIWLDFLERDEGEREPPYEACPWDGVSGVRPFAKLAASTTVGVY